jgi:glucose/arabinose dehydrogenase
MLGRIFCGKPGAALRPRLRRLLFVSLAIARAAAVAAPLAVTTASAAPAAKAAAPPPKSGYAAGPALCGEAPLGFPRIRIDMRPGYCAGLVASNDDGLQMPRAIVQIPNTQLFVVSDMGGWGAPRGRLLRLDPRAPQGKRLTVLISKLDHPHGLAIGFDGRVYASTAERIFRFDPQAAKPEQTVETIVQGLPGTQPMLDGKKIERNNHPLKHFVFDRTGRLYVNVGAPSDACSPSASETKPCREGEGVAPFAAIWAFTPPAGGVFPALKPGVANPPREIYARGLRNSMAMALHPRFPDEGFAFLQGENARDLPDPMKPNEEINAVERGRHYGWPYCYDLTTPSPEYAKFLEQPTQYRHLCTNTSLYRQPHSLLPPHGSPLAMLYYQGDRFPELKGKLIVGLHGYKPTGSRVLFHDVDDNGFPTLSPAPVRFGVSCAGGEKPAFRTEREGEVRTGAPNELISGWNKFTGVRPRGAPVGITAASDGSLWLVEDRNPSIIRIDVDQSPPPEPLGCDSRTDAQIAELVKFVTGDRGKLQRLDEIRTGLIEPNCSTGCHSNFGLDGTPAAQKNAAVLRYILDQDGWVYPGDHAAGRLHERVRGKGGGNIMPPTNGHALLKDPRYMKRLDALDLLVDTIVPGERRRVNASESLNLRNRKNEICGALPNDTPVTVINARPPEKPDFSRIFRPADKHLNGQCTDDDGYYVGTRFLKRP